MTSRQSNPRVIEAQHAADAGPRSPQGDCDGAASQCIRRRDLGALSMTGAAIALAGCGPDRGGLTPDEIQVDASGSVPLEELPQWSTSIVNFGGGQRAFVAVVRGEGEDVRGWEAYCTHQGCALTPQGAVLNCPCHGSTFDVESGEPNGGPAQAPLAPVQLQVVDGKVSRA